MAQRNQQYEKEYAIIRFHGFFMDDSVGVAKNPNARFPISLASECEMSSMLKSIEYRKSRAMKPYYIDNTVTVC